MEVLLDSKKFTIATDRNGAPQIRRSSRPSQPSDAGAIQYAEWRVDGHDFNSFEVIPAGSQAGYLGRDYGTGTDGRWLGLDCLGPKINTRDLSTFDTDSDIVRDANCSAVAYAVWATAYQYVGRGTRPAKIDLSDMSLKDGGKSLPRAVSDLIVTVAQDNEVDLSVIGTFTDAAGLTSPVSVIVSPDGNYAYVGTSSDGLVVIDISDPTNMSIVGSAAVNNIEGLALSEDGGTLYGAITSTDTVTVIDVSDPENPAELGSVQDSTNLDAIQSIAISADGDYVYTAAPNNDRFTVVDVSDPENPAVEGSIADGTNLNGAVSVATSADGAYAYVGCLAANRLTVMDVGTPASPTVEGSVLDNTNLAGALDLVVSVDGDYVYAAAFASDKFTVVDVQTPGTPAVEGNVAVTDLEAIARSNSGETVYAWTQAGTVSVIDVSTPGSPTVENTLSSDAFAGTNGELAVSPTTGALLVISETESSLSFLASSNLEVSAGQGDIAPYYALPVADIANPADTDAEDGWVENDDSVAVKVFGQAPDRVVGMAKNVIKSNILTGSVTMAEPNWQETATITGRSNDLSPTGFATDGNLWVIGTNDGPYMLDAQTREFFPIIKEIDLSYANCRNLSNWFPVGVVMPLQYALRYQKFGSGESFGSETFKANTSPVQGTPTAWTASTREGFEIRYNEEEGDAYLVVWREREPGDQHAGIMSPYVIAQFSDLRSDFLDWIGTVDGLRTNPTLTGGYGSNMFWLTAGRTARWIDDANYEYTSTGTTYGTEMRRLRNLLADVEFVELEVRRSDGGALDASKSVTVQLAFDEGIEGASYTTIGSAITEAGFQRLLASSNNVPASSFQGVRRMKPRWTLTTDDDGVSPQVIGNIRVYFRTRPTNITVHKVRFHLGDQDDRTALEQEQDLRDMLGSEAKAYEDLYGNTVYVRVTDVSEVQIDPAGQGTENGHGLRSFVDVTLEEWTTS